MFHHQQPSHSFQIGHFMSDFNVFIVLFSANTFIISVPTTKTASIQCVFKKECDTERQRGREARARSCIFDCICCYIQCAQHTAHCAHHFPTTGEYPINTLAFICLPICNAQAQDHTNKRIAKNGETANYERLLKSYIILIVFPCTSIFKLSPRQLVDAIASFSFSFFFPSAKSFASGLQQETG